LDTPDWDYTAENRLLFEQEYSTHFYRWTQRLLAKEWLAARLSHGESASFLRRLRNQVALWAFRGVVEILRQMSARHVTLESNS